jgi:hypothetical protein
MVGLLAGNAAPSPHPARSRCEAVREVGGVAGANGRRPSFPRMAGGAGSSPLQSFCGVAWRHHAELGRAGARGCAALAGSNRRTPPCGRVSTIGPRPDCGLCSRAGCESHCRRLRPQPRASAIRARHFCIQCQCAEERRTALQNSLTKWFHCRRTIDQPHDATFSRHQSALWGSHTVARRLTTFVNPSRFRAPSGSNGSERSTPMFPLACPNASTYTSPPTRPCFPDESLMKIRKADLPGGRSRHPCSARRPRRCRRRC